jgi:hypothetical protein
MTETMSPGKMELTIKLNEIPPATTVENGWKRFCIDVGSPIGHVEVKVKPSVWTKIEAARAFPQFVIALTGKMGPLVEGGFSLESPVAQVFERKPKEPKPERPIQGASVEASV